MTAGTASSLSFAQGGSICDVTPGRKDVLRPVPPLIAVIGPVESDLLRAFVKHYQGHGVQDFHLAFHFTAHAPNDVRDELIAVCEELVGPPLIISQGPW